MKNKIVQTLILGMIIASNTALQTANADIDFDRSHYSPDPAEFQAAIAQKWREERELLGDPRFETNVLSPAVKAVRKYQLSKSEVAMEILRLAMKNLDDGILYQYYYAVGLLQGLDAPSETVSEMKRSLVRSSLFKRVREKEGITGKFTPEFYQAVQLKKPSHASRQIAIGLLNSYVNTVTERAFLPRLAGQFDTPGGRKQLVKAVDELIMELRNINNNLDVLYVGQNQYPDYVIDESLHLPVNIAKIISLSKVVSLQGGSEDWLRYARLVMSFGFKNYDYLTETRAFFDAAPLGYFEMDRSITLIYADMVIRGIGGESDFKRGYSLIDRLEKYGDLDAILIFSNLKAFSKEKEAGLRYLLGKIDEFRKEIKGIAKTSDKIEVLDRHIDILHKLDFSDSVQKYREIWCQIRSETLRRIISSDDFLFPVLLDSQVYDLSKVDSLNLRSLIEMISKLHSSHPVELETLYLRSREWMAANDPGNRAWILFDHAYQGHMNFIRWMSSKDHVLSLVDTQATIDQLCSMIPKEHPEYVRAIEKKLELSKKLYRVAKRKQEATSRHHAPCIADFSLLPDLPFPGEAGGSGGFLSCGTLSDSAEASGSGSFGFSRSGDFCVRADFKKLDTSPIRFSLKSLTELIERPDPEAIRRIYQLLGIDPSEKDVYPESVQETLWQICNLEALDDKYQDQIKLALSHEAFGATFMFRYLQNWVKSDEFLARRMRYFRLDRWFEKNGKETELKDFQAKVLGYRFVAEEPPAAGGTGAGKSAFGSKAALESEDPTSVLWITSDQVQRLRADSIQTLYGIQNFRNANLASRAVLPSLAKLVEDLNRVIDSERFVFSLTESGWLFTDRSASELDASHRKLELESVASSHHNHGQTYDGIDGHATNSLRRILFEQAQIKL